MTSLRFLFVLLTLVTMTSCTKGQSGYSLSPDAFSAKVRSLPSAPILDVRTPGEYASGRIPKAQNIDWNSSTFMQSVAKFDKKKPVFVYCLAGSRSAAAASAMRSAGFKEVYELAGGVRGWKEKLVQ